MQFRSLKPSERAEGEMGLSGLGRNEAFYSAIRSFRPRLLCPISSPNQ